MGATPAAPPLEDWAIIVGVNYPSGSLPGLMGTLNDAAAFMEWLRSPTGGGLPRGNIRSASSPPRTQRSARTARPVQDQIDDILEDIGVGGSRKPIGRRLYFYFTGHGFGTSADDVCMLMAHATRNLLNRNIGLRFYRNFFQDHGYFQEVVFVLDCCREPVPPGGGSMAQPPSFTLEPDDPRPVVSDLVILAAPYGQKSHEILDPRTGKRRGLFTLALLDVLTGAVGVDGQGRHTGFNLRANLDARMKALSSPNGGAIAAQLAMVEPRDNLNTGLVLTSVPVAAASTVSVRIVAPDGARGELTVLEGTTHEIASRRASRAASADPPWLVDLLPTKSYSVRHQKSAAATPLFAVIDWAQLEATTKDGDYVFVFPDA